MTDKDKLSAVRAEIVRAMEKEKRCYQMALENGDDDYSHAPVVYTRLQMLLSFIESLQKESNLAAKSSKNLQEGPSDMDNHIRIEDL